MEKIKELLIKYREMILYLFFGGCTTLVNIVSYYICSRIGMGTAISTVIAWVLSVLFAYITNRKFVFESKACGFSAVLTEAANFFLFRLATGLLDLAIMVIFVDLLHFNDMVIKILSNIIVIILNYVASKLLIFKDKSSTDKMSNSNRLGNLLNKVPYAFRAIFCGYIAVTLLTLIFIDKSLNTYSVPNYLTVSNKLLILVSLLLLVLLVVGAYLLQRGKSGKETKITLSDKHFYIITAIIFVGVYLAELFISAHIYLKTGWDVKAVTEAAYNIALGGANSVPKEYFSVYPNNMLITYTLVFLLKIGKVFFASHPYKVILAFVSLVVCASVYLSVLCIYRITHSRKVTVCGMIIGIFLVAFSPWIVIPYTDSIGMIFPVTAVFCYLFVKNSYLRYSLMTFLCILGCYYKPTVIIILIALVILKTLVSVERLFKKELSLKRCACMLLCAVISVGCAFGVNKAVCSQNKTVLDEQKKMTSTHFLMMGLNAETEGVYNADDVDFSKSMPDVASRQKANISVAVKRLKEMGFKGYIKLLTKKNICTYNDGTFGWSSEGTFYYSVPQDNRSTTKVLRSFYYRNEEGTNYQIFAAAEQILWLFILICICFCILPGKTNTGAENLISLSLLGVSIFLLIFECRARYLFVFLPLFVILAAVGLHKAYLLFINSRHIRN